MFYYRDIFSVKTAQNPLVLIALILGLTLISACSGDSAPEQTTGPGSGNAIQVASGTFEVTAEIIFDTCNSSESKTGTYDINIDESNFAMGTEWTGTWDPKTLTGIGETEHLREVIRFCTKTTWTEVNVTFISEDEFSGEIIFRRRVDGDCSTPCTTTWRIHGTREPATP